MRRSLIGWLTAAVLAVGGAAFAYVFYFAGGSGEPSTELTTPEVISTTSSGAGDSTTSPTATTDFGPDALAVPYVVDPARTTASFEINEVLRSEPTTVIGTTDQVAGQAIVDPGDLGAS